MEEKFLNTKEVSILTGLSIPTLQKWVSHEKGFPFIRAGRRILYSQKDIFEYMENNKIQPTSIK